MCVAANISFYFHFFPTPLKCLMILRFLQEKDEKLDGDAALNKFFREIYSDADEDMRRAMMKSFVCALYPCCSPCVN